VPIESKQITAALEEARQGEKRGFNQAVDLVVNLKDIDTKKPGSKLNELVELPHPPPKEVKICVIGSSQMAIQAKEAGADRVIQREELEALGKDKKAARKLASQYDFFICEAPLMPVVGKILGSFLGPRGKMPTPVPPNSPIASIIAKHRKTVRVKFKEQPTIQCRVGVENMGVDQLAANIGAVLERLEQKLERGARNIKTVYVKTTMGKAVKVKLEGGKR